METTPLPPAETLAELAELEDGPPPILDRPVKVTIPETVHVREHGARSWVAQQITFRPDNGPVLLAGDVPTRTRFRLVSANSYSGSLQLRISHSAETCTLNSGVSFFTELTARGEVWACAFHSDPENPLPDDYYIADIVMEFA